MQASLVTDALRMAWFRRHPEPGLIFHSDRGSQYCSGMFQDAISSYGVRSSMSRKGDCWDNEPTESLWGSLKVGRLYGRRFAMQREAIHGVVDWLTFYNYRRHALHAGLAQPDEVRGKLARGPGQESRVDEWLCTTSGGGQVTLPVKTSLTSSWLHLLKSRSLHDCPGGSLHAPRCCSRPS